jgi:hypothetical protein
MNKVLYENIYACREFTEDQYWKDMIWSCSCNKFPKGVSYNNIKNTVYVRPDYPNKRTEMLALPVDDPETCFEVLMHIFKNLLNLRSDEDIKFSRIDIENARKDNEIDLDCEWKKLKPRSVKTQILINFSVEKVKSLNLENINDDMNLSNILYRLIQLGIQFKQISGEDIEYNNGVISSIKGINYNSKTQNFELTNKQGYISHTANKINHNQLDKSMDKWIKQYRTYY